QMFLQEGNWQGAQVVPADWVKASTVPSAPTAPGHTQYGLQWWTDRNARPGEYFARGVYGQYIYINQPAGVVIAVNSTARKFRTPGAYPQHIAAFRAIAEAAQ
ncbi:MAG TPA: 6-aminohexanoate hydrolase, partial [Aliiroseovarius sp.]|nr:6-aminohexanoate hydrolase [Aliiroseovarius sp.]